MTHKTVKRNNREVVTLGGYFLLLSKAADLDWKDFEDAVQYVAAKRIGIDYIVTRNKKDFKLSEIPVLSPQEVLKLI